MSEMSESAPENSGRSVAVGHNPKTGKPMPIGRKFQPGQSGNPGGRPRVVADIRALAQDQGEASIQALIRVRDNPNSPAAAVVAAALAIMDRGYGKAIQRQEHTGADGGPIQTQQIADDRLPVVDFLAEFSVKADKPAQH